MKKVFLLSVLVFSMFSTSLFAKDKILTFPISEALNSQKAKEVLDRSISYKFGEGTTKGIVKSGLTTTQKTSKINKGGDQNACNWAFLSAVKRFDHAAANNNVKKVVNLVSNQKNQKLNSKTQYQCAVGSLMVSVSLKGDLAK